MRPPIRSTRSSERVRSSQGAPLPPPKTTLPPPPNLKPIRHRMSTDQNVGLAALYSRHSHPDRDIKRAAAQDLGLPLHSVSIWLQNKRQAQRITTDFLPSSSLSSVPSNNSSLASTSDYNLHFSNQQASHRTSQNIPLGTLKTAEQSNFMPMCPCLPDRARQATIPAQELWTYLESSPVSEAHQTTNYCAGESHLPNGHDSVSRPQLKRLMTLELACDLVGKRGRDEDQDEDTELKDRASKRHKSDSNQQTSSAIDLAATDISSDILHGASLLVHFKHSQLP